MEAKSIQKYILTSPQKLREVVYMIKTLSPVNAVDRLPFTHKKAAEELGKVIKSAVANAKQMGAQESELVFKAIEINEGPRLKRFRAGSRGRAKPYARRMSHIRVVVETKPAPKVEAVKATEDSKNQVPNSKSQTMTKNSKSKKVETKKGATETSA
jgi:large subunit ribosomal protein L22